MVAFRVRASSAPDKNTLKTADKGTDESLFLFLDCNGAAAHATQDTEQLISFTSTALVDTIASVEDSDGGVIPVSEVHELLMEMCDILDNASAKKLGNTAHILAYHFNSASRQHCKV